MADSSAPTPSPTPAPVPPDQLASAPESAQAGAPKKVFTRDEDGKITEEATMVGGQLQGEAIIYKNGRVEARVNFVDGKLDGEALYYDPTGLLQVKALYRAGKLHGESTYFDGYGRLARKSVYEGGLLQGRTVDYWPHTQKAREISNYKADLLDGEQVRFTLDGKLESRLCFKDGKPIPCPQQQRPATGPQPVPVRR